MAGLKLYVRFCVTFFAFRLSFVEPSAVRIFRKYKIVHEAVEMIRARPEMEYQIRIRKFNQSTPVLEADLEIKDRKVNNFQVWIQGYERLGLEHIYTKSAISVTASYCDYISGKFLLNKNLEQYGNLPTKCPVKLGKYFLRDYVFDDKYLPPFMPGFSWRFDIHMGPFGAKLDSNETSKFSYYCKVVYL